MSALRRALSRRPFEDRRDAGRLLAAELAAVPRDRLLVLGLARGGVPVAAEVAAALQVPLDVFVVRKLGTPGRPELACGAIAAASGDEPLVVMNDDVVARFRLGADEIAAVMAAETAELRRRVTLYRGDRPPPALAEADVLLVDDGVATGASMLAAIRAVRLAAPRRIVVGVPVAPPTVCRQLGRVADEVVSVWTPESFLAVGEAYADFRQTADDEVRALLRG
ncbi:phosphoribosyltransferase [Mycobacterium sp. MYCO198283]|uniref:phosphoribosyltransferase n=1 Tax=Mycobacterium sp. MYCO198283 TaxID=2883505 RepID=UPI001E3976E7|nr:phosphoribosyltransferase family protein [Mycobacterium sp. MYCO198283]MCG5432741.1 phosphoribosyltransferase [Mycobacterium sp. MYCO198283]